MFPHSFASFANKLDALDRRFFAGEVKLGAREVSLSPFLPFSSPPSALSGRSRGRFSWYEASRVFRESCRNSRL